MTYKHIKDAIEISARQIAFEAYVLAKKHQLEEKKIDNDDLFDQLAKIVKKQLGE